MNNSKYTNIAYRAPISVDGSIGSWTKMSDGPITGDHTQPAIAGNKIYLIGGYNGNYLNTVYSADFASGITDYTQYYTEQLSASSSPVKESAGVPWQSQCGFNPSTQNDITGWASTNSLVTATTSAASLVTKNYMYILGGVGPDGALNTIQRASFDSDGNLTSDWSNVGTLPAAMGGMGYIATKGRFYLLGASSSSVYSAPINSDGTLGDFRSETSLPAAMRTSICFVIKDKLYAIGGNNNNSVYRTTVNNDGTLGSWETLSNFPINVVNGKPMLIKNRIYIFWASPDSNDNVSEIYYATYDSNGNIGSWYQYSSMPNSITDSAIVCTDNYVFSIAGYDNANIKYTNASYRAPISDNGNIGTWTQITDAPVTVIYAQSVIVGNRIYFIAGHNGKASNIVYSAAFTSGITDYSIFYNGPTPSSTFNLPDLPSTPYNAYYIKT
jgi:N-acetylneuraminic acid mutarotase